MLMDQQMSS